MIFFLWIGHTKELLWVLVWYHYSRLLRRVGLFFYFLLYEVVFKIFFPEIFFFDLLKSFDSSGYRDYLPNMKFCSLPTLEALPVVFPLASLRIYYIWSLILGFDLFVALARRQKLLRRFWRVYKNASLDFFWRLKRARLHFMFLRLSLIAANLTH